MTEPTNDEGAAPEPTHGDAGQPMPDSPRGGDRGLGQPMPDYKGEPLDAERGPGLGCFWIQVALLAILLVATPLSVVAAAPPWVSATLLIASLVILFFVGQTSIFLLRLVAADRGTRRVPRSSSARRTVGQLEDEATRSEQDDAGAR